MVIPVVVDVHATTVNIEYDVVVIGERLFATTPVVFEKIVSDLLQMNEQGGSTEGDRSNLFVRKEKSLLFGEVLAVAVWHRQAHAVDALCQLCTCQVVLVVPILLVHQLVADLAVTQVLQRPVSDADNDLARCGFWERFRTRFSEAEDCHGVVGEGRFDWILHSNSFSTP